MDLKEYYRNKNVLLTGCTGFVGKVLLEKVLFSLEPSKVRLLVR
jgi:thioester reductase-like protein